ncbi:uncharacterized protein BDZ83DRAFT_640461 [Colletotrichum acutatum]|uniref:Uncharacterized protein n=1 Tax=Glomerella acutata TaxID=27357 RepID=A0AAD8U7B7_GLOAC|nr:uncharacterized protein BDZ83DRAFT_640461 [Colletotrichum acutatum]KAK1710552.1 hypothetical protein BDZ83DRAFT_640461 [Colletotrichum acutatum]
MPPGLSRLFPKLADSAHSFTHPLLFSPSDMKVPAIGREGSQRIEKQCKAHLIP